MELLARVSQHSSAAAAYLPALTASCSVGDPRRTCGYACGRLCRIPCHHRHLRCLATSCGEKPGLARISQHTSAAAANLPAQSTPAKAIAQHWHGRKPGLPRNLDFPVLLIAVVLGASLFWAAGGRAAEAQGEWEQPPTLELVWQEDLGRRLGRSLAVSAGRVAAATVDRRVAVFDLASGQRLWRKKRKAGVQAGMRIAGDRILGVSDYPEGWLFCLEADSGDELWRLRLGESWGAPLIAGQRVYAASVAGRVVACSLSTGGLIWKAEVPGLVHAPIGMSDSLLFVPTLSDTLIALDAATGEQRWSAAPGGAVYGQPVLLNGSLWSLSYGGDLIGWDPATGDRRHQVCLEGFYRAGPAMAESVLVTLSTGGSLVVLETESLKVRWRRDLESAADLTPVLRAGLVWVALKDGSVQALRMADGRRVVRFMLGAPPATPVVLAHPYVLVGTADGGIIAWKQLGKPLRGQAPISVPGICPQATGGELHSGHTDLPRLSAKATAHAPSFSGWAVSADGHSQAHFRQQWPVSTASDPAKSRLKKGPFWTAGWVIGTGLALWFQNKADGEYYDYERTGHIEGREQAFDRAQRYDRYALAAWISSEVFFLLALRGWLSED